MNDIRNNLRDFGIVVAIIAAVGAPVWAAATTSAGAADDHIELKNVAQQLNEMNVRLAHIEGAIGASNPQLAMKGEP